MHHRSKPVQEGKELSIYVYIGDRKFKICTLGHMKSESVRLKVIPPLYTAINEYMQTDEYKNVSASECAYGSCQVEQRVTKLKLGTRSTDPRMLMSFCVWSAC